LKASWTRRMRSKSASEKRSGHKFGFFHADAVLAGKRAADFDAIADDFGGGFQGALELRGVAGIVEYDGCRLPSPAWKMLPI